MRVALLLGMVALATLSGCASQEMTIRTVPPETPAADAAAAADEALAPVSAIPPPGDTQDKPQPDIPVPEETPEDAPSMLGTG